MALIRGILRDVWRQSGWQIFVFMIFNHLANSEWLKDIRPVPEGPTERR